MSGTPAIRISFPHAHSSPSTAAAAATTPMSIPRDRCVVRPPPPLPPPKDLEIAPGIDPGWQFGNHGADCGTLASVRPGSSLLGKGFRYEKEHISLHISEDRARRGSSISTLTNATRDQDMMTDDGTMQSNSDEDGSGSAPPSNYRLHGVKQLEQRTLEDASNSYDKHLLSRIGGPNSGTTSKRQSISSFAAASIQETAQLAHAESERRNSQFRPLSSVSERPHPNSLDSPCSLRWPQSGAISPGSIGFWGEHGPPENTRTDTRHGSLAFEDSLSSYRGSYDQNGFAQDDFMDDGHMSSLNLHDRSASGEEHAAKAGTKRRASSPPREGLRDDRLPLSSASGQSEPYPRRTVQQFPNRGSPVSRFHTHQSSLSSTSSFGPRHGSFGSSLGVSSVPSSATSYGSGRLSPGALSPSFESDGRLGTPYGSTNAMTANISSATSGPQHHRVPSDMTLPGASKISVDSALHSRNSSISQGPLMFPCECCPKKPKKFETQDELRQHELEKQYTCAYCPNRFKNKNEAERHQNSLHLRRHSWSCAALAGPEAAYHTSLSGNDTDTCGYCGEEFPNPPQWNLRAEHLNHSHKFGDCNQSKKFFRADHFRQHLKHSHAGTSGKWTNMLENACMKDEPLPEKRTHQGEVTPRPGAGPTSPALAVASNLASPQPVARVGIDEILQDS